MWQNNNPKRKNLKKWAKQNLPYYCQHCGKTGKLELDHIINIKAGGPDTPENLQWLCPHCHNKKTQQEATKARNAWKKPKEQHPALRHKNRNKGY